MQRFIDDQSKYYFLHKELDYDDLGLHLKAVIQRFVDNPNNVRFSLSQQFGHVSCSKDNVEYSDLAGIYNEDLKKSGNSLSARFSQGRNKEIFFRISGYGDRIDLYIKTYHPKIDSLLFDAFFREFDLEEVNGQWAQSVRKSAEVVEEEVSTPSVNCVQVDLVALKKMIIARFNLSEIQEMCFDLNVKYDDLSDSNRLSMVAQDLIEEMRRMERLGNLIVEIGNRRPHCQWAEIVREI